MLKHILVALICIGVVAGVAAVIFGPLSKVGVSDFGIDQVSNVALDGFTLSGTLTVDNPSMFSIEVKGIDYDLIVDSTGESVGTGSIQPFFLSPDSSETVPFVQDVAWKTTLETAMQFLQEEHVYLKIDGTATVTLFNFYEAERPVTGKIDIKPLVKQQVDAMTAGFAGLLG